MDGENLLRDRGYADSVPLNKDLVNNHLLDVGVGQIVLAENEYIETGEVALAICSHSASRRILYKA